MAWLIFYFLIWFSGGNGGRKEMGMGNLNTVLLAWQSLNKQPMAIGLAPVIDMAHLCELI